MAYCFMSEDVFARVKYASVSMQFVLEMFTERKQIEMRYAQMLITFNEKWMKKIQDACALECFGIREIFTGLLYESVSASKISRMLTRGLGSSDGPLSKIKVWIKIYEKQNDGFAAQQDYKSAMEKFNDRNEKIHKYMLRYHCRRTTYDMLNKRREVLRRKMELKPEKQNKYYREIKVVDKRMIKFENQSTIYHDKYQASLSREKKERQIFKNAMADVKAKFDSFEIERVTTMFTHLKTIVSFLKLLDSKRQEHETLLEEMEEKLNNMDIKKQIQEQDNKYLITKPYPVFKEYEFNSTMVDTREILEISDTESVREDEEEDDSDHDDTIFTTEKILREESDSSSSDSDDEVPRKVDKTIQVSQLSSVKVIATEKYTARKEGELSFEKGQTIKQKFSANDEGMAFGYIKKGKFSRKKRGFYPVELVVLKSKGKKDKPRKSGQSTEAKARKSADRATKAKARRSADSTRTMDPRCSQDLSSTTSNESESTEEEGTPKPKTAFENTSKTEDEKVEQNDGKKSKSGLKNRFKKLFKKKK